MRSLNLSFAIVVLTILTWPTQSAEICRIHCTKDESVNICGRSGNICKRFANDCSLQIANCINENAYSQVDLFECRYIDLNVQRICNTGILTVGAGFGQHSVLNSGSKTPFPQIIRVL